MIDAIRELLGAYYQYIKFVHLLAAMMWSWSTAVAYVWYIKDAWKEWVANPHDPILKARRDWAFEQFDKGVVLEHLAFPVILITGPLMIILAGWPLMTPWLVAKLAIVVFVFIPIEIFDYWLSHMGGNKTRVRKQNDPQKFDHFIRMHWIFFQITTPLIVIFMPLVVFLATVKPALW